MDDSKRNRAESSVSPEQIRKYYELRGFPCKPHTTGWHRFMERPTDNVIYVNFDNGDWGMYSKGRGIPANWDEFKAQIYNPEETGGILEWEMRREPDWDRYQCLLTVRSIIPNFPHHYYTEGSNQWSPTYDVVIKEYGLGPMPGWLYIVIQANTVRKGLLKGRCVMSQAKLAAAARMSVRALHNVTKILQCKRLLLVTRGQHRNTYELVSPAPNPFRSARHADQNGDSDRHHVPHKNFHSASNAAPQAPGADLDRYHVPSEPTPINNKVLDVNTETYRVETKHSRASDDADAAAIEQTPEPTANCNSKSNSNPKTAGERKKTKPKATAKHG